MEFYFTELQNIHLLPESFYLKIFYKMNIFREKYANRYDT